MTRCHALAVAMLLAVASPSKSRPDFIPNPHQTFEGFVSINAPRPDVPVGALWIQGYGPTGEAASPDNVETVRSLNGVTVDKNLQLSASAGLLSLFGIDPRLRDHFTAHFTDLTLVRVKDPSKLSGPAGEPRILEALKAGGITISSDSGVDLNGRTINVEAAKISGQTANSRARTFSIDGRDLFIAIKVATLKRVEGRARRFDLTPDGERGGKVRVDDFALAVANIGCGAAAANGCGGPPNVTVRKLSTQQSKEGLMVALQLAGPTTLTLPVPISDGDAGLYTKLSVEVQPSCARARADGCGHRDRINVAYVGERIETLNNPKGEGW